MSKHENSTSSVVSFLLGVSTGILLGILFAPKSGRETREDLKGHMEVIKENANHLREKGNVVIAQGKRKAQDFVEKVQEKTKKSL